MNIETRIDLVGKNEFLTYCEENGMTFFTLSQWIDELRASPNVPAMTVAHRFLSLFEQAVDDAIDTISDGRHGSTYCHKCHGSGGIPEYPCVDCGGSGDER